MLRNHRIIVFMVGAFLFCGFTNQIATKVSAVGRTTSSKNDFVDYQYLAEKLSFINGSLNQLTLPPLSGALSGFHEKMAHMIFTGKGKVNVFHIGGSHVQAGTFGNKMRENFIELCGNTPGERGFFFPYKVANTNGPAHIQSVVKGSWEACRSAVSSHSCNWGLAGIQATTQDSVTSLKLWSQTEKSLDYSFNRVKIFHPVSAEQFCLQPEAGTYEYIRTDSIGGFTEIRFHRMMDTLNISWSKSEIHETNFTLQGIRLENDLSGLSYNEIGVNGASVPSYLRSPFFQNQLAGQPADLVIFGIGINDAHKPTDEFNKETFKQNYRALIARFRACNPEVNFVFLTNNDSYYNRKPNKNAITVRQAMIELGEENNCAVWDFFEIMGGLGSIVQWQNAGLAKNDKIHFTSAGYELMADLLFDALQKDFMTHLRQSNHTQKAR